MASSVSVWRTWAKRNDLVVISLIVGLAIGLRLWAAHYRPIDSDELGQIGAIESWEGMLAYLTKHHNSPPLNLLIARLAFLVAGAPQDPKLLRLVDVAFTTSAVAFQYHLVRALWQSRGSAIIAALLMALSPVAVDYGSIIRMYSVFLALATLTLYAYVRYSRGDTRPWLVVWVGGSMLLLYTHYSSSLLVAVLLLHRILHIFVGVKSFRRLLLHPHTRGVAAMGLIILLSSLPSLALFYIQSKDVGFGAANTAYPSTVYALIALPHQWSASHFLQDPIWLALVVDGISFTFLSIGFVASWRGFRSSLMFILLVALLPLAVLSAYTELVGPVIHSRYVVFILPLWYALIALGITTVTQRINLWPITRPYQMNILVISSSIVLAGFLTVPGLVKFYTSFRPGLDVFASWVESHEREGDSVLLAGVFTAQWMYLYGGDVPIHTWPETIDEFESQVINASSRKHSCLWVVWGFGAHPYWSDRFVLDDPALIKERKESQLRILSLLTEYSSVQVTGESGYPPGHPFGGPSSGLYLVCDAVR